MQIASSLGSWDFVGGALARQAAQSDAAVANGLHLQAGSDMIAFATILERF
jgi:hypothetical protein